MPLQGLLEAGGTRSNNPGRNAQRKRWCLLLMGMARSHAGHCPLANLCSIEPRTSKNSGCPY
eukprot:2804916-Lingulodinium_polyedra.AAC.1